MIGSARLPQRIALVAVAAGIGAVWVLGAFSDAPASSTEVGGLSPADVPERGPDYCPAPASRMERITEERQALAEIFAQRNQEELARSGFQIMKSRSLLTGEWVCGWIDGIPNMEDHHEILAARASAPLGLDVTPFHDAPNGGVMGYAYGKYGYLPAEVANSGTFDIIPALEARIAESEAISADFVRLSGIARDEGVPVYEIAEREAVEEAG